MGNTLSSAELKIQPLKHGGNLQAAAREQGIAINEWIDLSTGISPWSWPVPQVPDQVWQQLPQQDDDLLSVAASYYGCDPQSLIAVPGSQHGIAVLPQLLMDNSELKAFHKKQAAVKTVALPSWGYQEHHYAWLKAGCQTVFYHTLEDLMALVAQQQVDYALVINPNNPTGQFFAKELLRSVADSLAIRGGCLIVDEAFMDATPEQSLSAETHNGLIIFRSLGKFFGLAGARLGFVIGAPELIAGIGDTLNPWAVNHPARWVACQALADRDWHRQQRLRLSSQAERWCDELSTLFPEWVFSHTAYFVSARASGHLCQALYALAAKRGMLLRSFNTAGLLESAVKMQLDPDAGLLRFGLPDETTKDRAITVLQEVSDARSDACSSACNDEEAINA